MIWRSFSNYQFIRIKNPEVSRFLEEKLTQIDSLTLRRKLKIKHNLTLNTINSQITGKTALTIPVLNDILLEINSLNGEMIKWILSTSRVTSGVGGVSPSVKIPTELDSDLAYLIGALRDGNLSVRSDKGDYVVEIYQKNTAWLKEIILPICERLFDINLKLKMYNRAFGNYGRVRIWSKPILVFIRDVFEHPFTRNKAWNTPKVILQANTEIQKAYISGFFDTEGWLAKNFRSLAVVQSWHENDKCPPLDDIKMILQSMGIKSSVRNRSGKTNPNWKPRYLLSITNKNGIRNFILNIGSRHPDKAENLENFLRLCKP